MNTHADKTRENISQSIAIKDSHKQSSGEATLEFIDNRPEAAAQRKLQEMANNSPQAMHLRAFQGLANNCPQVKPAAQLGTKVNYTPLRSDATVVQRHQGAYPTGLKGEPTVDEIDLKYGAIYVHTVLSSSDNMADLEGILCREIVVTTSPQIKVNAPVIKKEFSIANKNGKFNDKVYTRPDLVKTLVERGRQLELELVQLVSTQTFQWQDNETGGWKDFAKIPIVFGVYNLKKDPPQPYTSSNGKISTEDYRA